MSKAISTELRSIFSQNLVRARKHFHLSQEATAAAIGTKRPTYAAYEEGRSDPSITTLLKLAEVFRISNLKAFLSETGYDFELQPIELPSSYSHLEVKYAALTEKERKLVDLLIGG